MHGYQKIHLRSHRNYPLPKLPVSSYMDDTQPILQMDTLQTTYTNVMATSGKLRDKLSKHADLLTKKACADVFAGIDNDKSGSLDISEVYIGVLLVYCKLGAFVAGLTPPPMQSIEQLLKEVDLDKNGSLDVEEFTALCSILLGGITTRVIGQLFLQLVGIPYLSLFILTRIGYYLAGTGAKEMHISPILITVFSILLNILVIPRVMHAIDVMMLRTAERTKCIKTK